MNLRKLWLVMLQTIQKLSKKMYITLVLTKKLPIILLKLCLV
jgi:hypothetical protein